MALKPQDVVDTADPKTLSEGELCLWIMAELNALVHRADDICPAQELVRDELSRPSNDSERGAAVGDCTGFVHAPHVANSPPGWRCIQIVYVVDDFCFQRISLSSDHVVGDVEILEKKQHQDWVTHDVAIVHVPLISARPPFFGNTCRGS